MSAAGAWADAAKDQYVINACRGWTTIPCGFHYCGSASPAGKLKYLGYLAECEKVYVFFQVVRRVHS